MESQEADQVFAKGKRVRRVSLLFSGLEERTSRRLLQHGTYAKLCSDFSAWNMQKCKGYHLGIAQKQRRHLMIGKHRLPDRFLGILLTLVFIVTVDVQLNCAEQAQDEYITVPHLSTERVMC